jgi:3-deoxy-D-manno-octulosonic-acid transferase
LSYLLYDLTGLLLGLLALPVLPFLLLTRHGRALGERLGAIPDAARRLQRPIWVHAASVGEVLAAQPLVDELRRRRPDTPLLVSTTSLTGRETARARLAADAVMLLPLDVGWIVGRVMRRVAPRCLVLVETEIWPALIRAAARQRVSCVMISGRVSERAAKGYERVGWLMRAVLPHLSALAMQTDADAARIVGLGAPADRVQVLGSLKLARELSSAEATAGPHPLHVAADGRPLLVAASTHAGEEALVLDACAQLWAGYPRGLLLLAPRRPERFDEVERLLASRNLRYERRSAVRHALRPETQVLLLDTIGELPDVLPSATAVFVGGTIAPIGGHNVLEPAACGKPVSFGPRLDNVRPAADALLRAGAADLVRDADELRAAWTRVLAAPEAAAQMGARGRTVVAAGAAVAARTAELVLHHMAQE